MADTDRAQAGLTSAEAARLREQYGKNELSSEKNGKFIKKVIHILKEPMFLLLFFAAAVYFILGEPGDGAVMLIFIVAVVGIDVAQEWKTDRTLAALKKMASPRVRVRRDGIEQVIPGEELVPGDVFFLCEGDRVPADASIITCSDFCVDESMMTGESEGVWKTETPEIKKQGNADMFRKDYCYAGTLVTQGNAMLLAEHTGADTEYGKIGLGVASAPEEPTPLQRQTNRLVRICALIAAVFFTLAGIFTWLNLTGYALQERFTRSVLAGVTLAMALIPEEFPVVLTVFLSMGAWRLAKKRSLVRRLPSVETLGAVTVLCCDKTGTLTMNKMSVQETWAADGDEKELLRIMGMGCEPEAYDPMEQAMIAYCREQGIDEKELFGGRLVKEYAFSNKKKIMGHVWQQEGRLTAAVKGSPETITEICTFGGASPVSGRDNALRACERMADRGLRVIAVASGTRVPIEGENQELPEEPEGFGLKFLGLIGLSDPPREGVAKHIKECRNAGIRVIMITGDNAETAMAVAGRIGIESRSVVSGSQLDELTEEELCGRVGRSDVFSRVIPEHKMRIVKALKKNGEVVAMTGDGVNDAPALKYADIGIAMGMRGSEVSREAADLILLDDNFATIVETVKDGRRIYDNICKAVGYILTIHIPIIFASLLPPLLGTGQPSLMLLPVHIVLLELVIDPTCSIVLERQPAEQDIMDRKPVRAKEKLLKPSLLIKSISQGLVIALSSFLVYYCKLRGCPEGAETSRSMGLMVIMISNLFLVLVNCSDSEPALLSLFRLMKDRGMQAAFAGMVLMQAVLFYSPVSRFLKLAPLTALQLAAVLAVSALSVFWYEIVKYIKVRGRRTGGISA